MALTRLLFYQRESAVAEIHGHLDTVHKSLKEAASYRVKGAVCDRKEINDA